MTNMEIDGTDHDHDDNTEHINNINSVDELNLITHDEVNAVFASIFKEIDDGGDEAIPDGSKLNGISRSLLQLYEMQHVMYDTIHQQELILEEEFSYQNEMQQQSIEYEYEQLYLLQQIQYYEQLFNIETLPYLIQFAKEEIGDVTTETTTISKNNNDNIDSSSDEIMTMNDEDENCGGTRATSAVTAGSSLNSDREVVKIFLLSNGLHLDSIDDREKILEFIKTCMEERTTLMNKIQNETNEIQVLQQEYKIHSDLLNHSIPTHIQTLERATVSLSKLLYSTSSLLPVHTNTTTPATTDSSSSGNSSSIQHMTGNERISRIQMAQQLSSIPLYTIYQSLQHYFDVVQTQLSGAATGGDATTMIGKVSVDNHLNEVILHLPVLNVGNTTLITNTTTTAGPAPSTTTTVSLNNKNNKKVTMVLIHFVHHTSPIPYITVYCTGCAPLLNQDILLDELLPYDLALNDSILHANPSTNVTTINTKKINNSNSNSNNNNNGIRGKSYLWCNHLAGLYPVPVVSNTINDTTNNASTIPSTVLQQQQHVSTHVVMNELQRRIRANATLKYILHSLCRSRVPTPPLQLGSSDDSYSIIYVDPNWKSKCKLINFSSMTATALKNAPISNTTTTTYNVEVRQNVNVATAVAIIPSNFVCTVQISNARYPAVVPIWNFINRSSSSLPNNDGSETNDVTDYYDTHLAQLRYRVNVDILDMIQHPPNTHGNQSDRGEDLLILQFCEWILVHQLREIMHFVDSLPENTNDSLMEYPMFKGRDRQIR